MTILVVLRLTIMPDPPILKNSQFAKFILKDCQATHRLVSSKSFDLPFRLDAYQFNARMTPLVESTFWNPAKLYFHIISKYFDMVRYFKNERHLLPLYLLIQKLQLK